MNLKKNRLAMLVRFAKLLVLLMIVAGSAAFASLDLVQRIESPAHTLKSATTDRTTNGAKNSRTDAKGKSSEFPSLNFFDSRLVSLSQLVPFSSPRASYTSTIVSAKTQPFANSPSDCNLNGSCALNGVQFIEYKKLFRFSGEPEKLASHFTDTRFVIKTDRVADLESFGVVQFIRGCMFRTRLISGVPTKELSISRNEFGQTVVFQHKTWEIDNDNDDPLISSSPGYGRFALLRWNKDPKSVATDGSTYYANAKPPQSTVFLSDMPSGGALMPSLDVADNTTLEFKTCIFKIQDLPLKTDVKGSNLDPAKALFCANWTHNYVFNFATQKMDEPKAADPICDVSL